MAKKQQKEKKQLKLVEEVFLGKFKLVDFLKREVDIYIEKTR